MRKISKRAFLTVGSFGFTVLGLGNFSHAAIYLGNGATGFNGGVGNGNVTITDDGTNITLTLNDAVTLDNDLVIYIDSVSGGFPDTSQFSDNGDGGRTAISGYNSGNPSRTVATFPAGFDADYALSIENSFIGLFQLVSGGNNSLNYITGQNQSGLDNTGAYTVVFPIADLGITPGQSFNFVGSLISESAYRSNETIGPSVTVPGDGAGNAGFSNPQQFTGFDTYTTTAVPEPAALSLIGGVMSLLSIRRRRA